MELDFVTPPSKTYFCPLTNEFLLQPYQTVCCGNHLSATAVAQNQNGDCPFCGSKQLACILDKFYQRQLSAINVRCSNTNLGCKWIGNVALLKRHLNNEGGDAPRETAGNEYEFVDYDCSYVEVSCPAGCPEIIYRGNVKEHMIDSCIKREYKCQYCGYMATYEEIIVKHWPVCPDYILPCPNECGASGVTRAGMDSHVRRCPKTRIPCAFAYAGCPGYAASETPSAHTERNVGQHLDLLGGIVISMHSEVEKKNAQISHMERKMKQQDEAIRALTQQLQSLAGMLRDERPYPPPQNPAPFIQPPDVVVPSFYKYKRNDEWWFSHPFYSHVGGYKMCVGVCPNGAGKFKGSHVSLAFHVMRGPFDDDLVWPFRGELTVQLVNQKKMKSQLEETMSIHEDTVSEKATSRVMNGERNVAGFGFLQFVSHKQLKAMSGCLENDVLRIRILKINVA